MHIKKALAIVLLTFLLLNKVEAGEVDMAVIAQIESSNNPFAVGKGGEIGLMQINPIVLADFNENYTSMERKKSNEIKNANFIIYDRRLPLNNYDLYDYRINIFVGNWYITERIPQMLCAYGLEDTTEARLFCYNAGIGNYIKYKQGKIKMSKETKQYIFRYKRLALNHR